MPIDSLFNSANLRRGEFSRESTPLKYPPALEFEPKHQTISLSFSLENKIAKGFVETQLISKVQAAQVIKYDAVNLNVEKVEGPDEWHYNGTELTCIWKNPIPKGQAARTKVYYSIDHPISGLYFSYPDEKYPNRPKYAATDVESIRARYWLPCIDHLSVRCTLDFFLTSESSHIILANGKLISEDIGEDGKKTAHWKLDFPCPSYLITFAVGEFIEYKDRDADSGREMIPVSYYTTKNFMVNDLGKSFAGTPEFIEWMVRKFKCPLEWPKYFQIASTLHRGAMENISLVTWGDFAIMDERTRKEFKWLVDSINVHELSHSWFGDMIVCQDFAHAWLKESWATYVEKLYYEDFFGEEEYLYGMYEDRRDYMRESDERYARPIVTKKYESSWDMYDNHLYPGGSFRLHMLRKKIGDEAFFAGTSDYLNTFKGKTVETVDFQRKLEDYSGMNLEPFFDQWFYSAGYPKLKAEFSYDEKNRMVQIRLVQNQVDEKSKIGVFHFPLVIAWETSEGEFNNRKYEITQKVQNLYFECARKPLQVRIDPEFHQLYSLEFNPGQDMLIRQLNTDVIIGKIHAAYELGKIGTHKSILAIFNQYQVEKFWGLKVEFIKAILSSYNYYAIESAVKLLNQEQDPKVLFHTISLLEGKRHKIVIKMIKNFVERPEFFYYSKGMALKVLGSQRNDEMWEYLSSYSIKEDFNGIIEGALYQAIGKLRTEKALTFLKDRLLYGSVDDNLRQKVYIAVGDALTWADKRVKEQFLELFQTELEILIQEMDLLYLGMVMRNLKILQVVGLLEALKSRISSQFHPRLEKWIENIQKKETSEESSKQKTEKMEKIEKLLGKLVDRVEKLENKLFPAEKNDKK
ncbi:MAG: M1 family aminopeptidase [Promethearchaeota archaeon]